VECAHLVLRRPVHLERIDVTPAHAASFGVREDLREREARRVFASLVKPAARRGADDELVVHGVDGA
jgi:hypothetical protein